MKASDFLEREFSFSKLMTFAQCPRKFFYRYVMRKSTEAPHLIYGSAVHAGMQHDNEQREAGRLVAQGEIVDVGVAHLKERSARAGLMAPVDRFAEEYAKQVEVYDSSGIRGGIVPVPDSVEAPFELELKIGNPENGSLEASAKVLGFVDVISQRAPSGPRAVIDYKTGQKPVYPRDAQESIQVELYTLGAPADEARLVSFVKGGRQRATVKVTPPVVPSAERRNKLLTWLADNIRSIRRALRGGDFLKCAPTCTWCRKTSCDYYDMCYPSKASDLPKLVQVERIVPVGEAKRPDWRK